MICEFQDDAHFSAKDCSIGQRHIEKTAES